MCVCVCKIWLRTVYQPEDRGVGTSRLNCSLQFEHTEENLTPRFVEAGVEPTSLTQFKTTLYSEPSEVTYCSKHLLTMY